MRRLPVLYREQASADLDGIFDYLVELGASGSTAQAFVGRIQARCEKIGNVPEGYPLRPDFGPGIRFAPFERTAVILYYPSDDAVEIVRIFYGGRDYAAMFIAP